MFLIIEHRCRRVIVSKGTEVKHKCVECGNTLLIDDMWDIDGELFCSNCSILERS